MDDLLLLALLLHDVLRGGNRAGGNGRARRAAGGPVTAMLLSQLQHGRPVGSTGHGEDDVARPVTLSVVITHLLRGQRRHAAARSQHRLAERMSCEVKLHHAVVGDGGRLILVHADLFEDHLLLHVEVILPERREEDARLDIERFGQVLGKRRGIEDGALFAGHRVVVGTDLVEDAIHVLGREPFGPLERHVFEKMADARHDGGLVPRTGSDVEAEPDAVHVVVQLGHDFEAVRERCVMELHDGRWLRVDG